MQGAWGAVSVSWRPLAGPSFGCTLLIFVCRSFWTLTGSPTLLIHPTLKNIAAEKSCTAAQALYKLAQLHGITPLSGTTNETHMTEDVAVDKIDLSAEDDRIRTLLAWMGLP